MYTYTKLHFAAAIGLSLGLMVGNLEAKSIPHGSVLELDRTTYFQQSGGQPIQFSPGTYEVEGTESGMRIISTTKDAKEVFVEADKMEITETVLFPTTDENPDLTHLILLMPDGTAYETVGSHTGVWPRGLMTKIRQAQGKHKNHKCPPNAKCALKKPHKVPKQGRRLMVNRKPISSYHSTEHLRTIARTLCAPVKQGKNQHMKITGICEKEVSKALQRIEIPSSAKIGG